jgi:hypothetical protein
MGMTRRFIAMMALVGTLLITGALANRLATASGICLKARQEHRLIYPMQRCIVAEFNEPEDY